MHNINILQHIKASKGKFTPQQVKIATYLLENHAKAAFFTATQLAREVGVSQPTVIRFAQMLGFPQYSMFLEAFQNLLKEELTSTDRLNLSLGDKKSTRENDFDIVFREMRTLDRLAQSFPLNDFHDLVDRICQGRRVVVAGTRGSASLAQYLAYFLGKVKRHVYPVTQGSTSEYDQMLSLGQRDLVIGIAFPRYPRETVEFIRFCSNRGIQAACITDKMESPLVALSQLSLVIPITFSTIFDSYCSALCLFSMLVTEVGRRNLKESEALIGEFEALAKEVKIFS